MTNNEQLDDELPTMATFPYFEQADLITLQKSDSTIGRVRELFEADTSPHSLTWQKEEAAIRAWRKH